MCKSTVIRGEFDKIKDFVKTHDTSQIKLNKTSGSDSPPPACSLFILPAATFSASPQACQERELENRELINTDMQCGNPARPWPVAHLVDGSVFPIPTSLSVSLSWWMDQ